MASPEYARVDIESPLRLRELDPSPIEETPKDYLNDDKGYFPPPNPLPRRTTTFMGLGDHGPVFYLSRIQRYSSYVFSIFGVLHITNTAIIPLLTRSVSSSESYLLLTRPYYQSRPQEPLLIGIPVALHVISGIAMRVYRRRASAKRYGAETTEERRKMAWPKLSGTSALGYALIPLAAIHTFVVRGLPLWYEGSSANSGLGYVAHGFAILPAISFFGYTALVGTAVMHFSWGWARWLGKTPGQVHGQGDEKELRKKKRWYAVNGAAGVVMLVWLAGGLGVIGRGGQADGWLAGVYDGLYRKIPVIGHWI